MSEVALSVQFEEPVVDIAALAAFTTAVAEIAPALTHQPVLPRIEETFDAPFFVPAFQIIDQTASLPRTWFAGHDGYLVQLQPDRLTLNWRRERPDAVYPGYAAIRERFDTHLRDLQRAVLGTGRDLPAVEICDVTYVNPVEVPGGGEEVFAHPDLAMLINRLRPAPVDGFLGPPEDAQYQARWRIPHPNDARRAIGRLYLAAGPLLAADAQTPLYLVNLTAHVLPVQEDSGIDALNIAHEYVVLGFKDLTTTKMHDHWRLKEPR